MDEQMRDGGQPAEAGYRRLRLRDFGAFQPDITLLETLKTGAFAPNQSPARDAWRGRQEPEVAKLVVLPVTGIDASASGFQGMSDPQVRGDFQSRGDFQGTRKGYPYYEERHGRGDPGGRPGNAAAVRKKKYLSLLLRVGGTLLLFALLFRSFSWSSLWLAMGHVRHGMVLLSLVVGAGGIVLSSYQWRSLLLGERIRYDLADLINLYVVGIAFSHFLPTGMGGDAIKALQVGRESGNSAGSTSAVLMCRITGFFGMLLIALPVLGIWHAHFSSSFLLTFALLSLLVGGMIGGAVLSVTVLPKLIAGKWAKSRLGRHRLLKRIAFASVVRVGNALVESAKRPRSMSMAMIYGIVFWLLAVLNCYAYALALGIGAPLYFYFVVVPLISLVSFLPISINGYGLRESAFVFTFATVHVQPATALTLALLLDVQALLFGLAGGCIYLTLGKKANAMKQRNAA